MMRRVIHEWMTQRPDPTHQAWQTWEEYEPKGETDSESRDPRGQRRCDGDVYRLDPRTQHSGGGLQG